MYRGLKINSTKQQSSPWQEASARRTGRSKALKRERSRLQQCDPAGLLALRAIQRRALTIARKAGQDFEKYGGAHFDVEWDAEVLAQEAGVAIEGAKRILAA